MNRRSFFTTFMALLGVPLLGINPFGPRETVGSSAAPELNNHGPTFKRVLRGAEMVDIVRHEMRRRSIGYYLAEQERKARRA